MTWWGWIMFGTAALWLAPASLFRASALALLVGWVVVEVIFQSMGIRLEQTVYLILDALVIVAVVFRRSHWSDWLILAPYPVIWYLYTLPVTRDSWIALYWLTFSQFVVAGPWPFLQKSLESYSHGSIKQGQKEASALGAKRVGGI